MADYFGVSDPVRALVPPEGYEDVHADGYSWAIQGKLRENTTWIAPADWNMVLANMRGLLTVPGYVSLPTDPKSPWILRDAITSFVTSKTTEMIPGLVLAQVPAMAGELEAPVTAAVLDLLGNLDLVATYEGALV